MMYFVISNIISGMLFYVMFVVDLLFDVLLTIPNYMAEAFQS